MKSIAKYILIVASLTAFALAEPIFITVESGKQYLVEGDQLFNWFEAQHKCQQHNMQLVEVLAADQQQQLEDILRPEFPESINLWLGANDEFNPAQDFSRAFRWSASGSDMGYSNWTPNNPDNYQSLEHCVHIWNSGKTFQWNDNKCTVKMGYVCEPYFKNNDRCNMLTEKAGLVKSMLNDTATNYQTTQKYMSEYLDMSLASPDASDKNFASMMLMQQNSFYDQAIQMLSNHKQYLNEWINQKINETSMRTEIINMSINSAEYEFMDKFVPSRDEIGAVLQC